MLIFANHKKNNIYIDKLQLYINYIHIILYHLHMQIL